MNIIDRLKIEQRKEPHEPIWGDAIAEIERLREGIIMCDCTCPCCSETETCLDDCTFADDCPNEHERMCYYRELLQPNAALSDRGPITYQETSKPLPAVRLNA